ncbi:hypothetical protein SAMN05920897_11017 [Alkalispirochaeta americana]|uniref:Uncharacterized protein n=1 Tax=Alkalispirochaeta americana TaxID=159291 RepID=A0A1N6TDT3_9SPIO|nr:hypothetical protein [Alkalispirochaeta americana]SIQ51529.1 hypothetical protein SAMN05920897_11017 [Alkalispirochaeta americana]
MGKRGNRSKNRGQNNPNRPRTPKKKRPIPFDPEKHLLPPEPPERNYSSCPLSGEEIDDIVNAIAHPQTGAPVRFDSVIKSLREQESEELAEDERLAYLGRGNFGIVKIEKKGKNRPELVVRKYFHYEDTHDKQTWRKELSPGISRDYIPNPQPLADLYTSEELAAFPRFDASSSAVTLR